MEVKNEGGGRAGGGELEERRRKKGIILTDSNGRGATENSIKEHIPRSRREEFEIAVVPTYTLEEAYYRVKRGEVDVNGAVVVIDCITNDVRGTQRKPAATPEEAVNRVDMLQGMLRANGAEDVITMQIKPMQFTDVTSHNHALNEYLLSQGGRGYGCETQIRLEYLRNDGFHVMRQYDSVIDKNYACALLGISPPSPTPQAEFEPEYIRRKREVDWPHLRGRGVAQMDMRYEGQSHVHGWRWW